MPVEDLGIDPPRVYPPAQIVNSGVDWITVTQSDMTKRRDLFNLGYTLWSRSVSGGNKPTPFRAHGYDGLHALGVVVAERDDSVLLTLSSDTADVHWRDALRLASNCSRLDLQVTVRFNVPQPDLHLFSYVTAAALSKARGKPLSVSSVISNKGGGTTYLGSRQSDEYARVYDKEAESRDLFWKNAWRFEVVRQNESAFQTGQHLGDGPDWRERVRAVVWDYFAQRGVVLPFERGGGNTLHIVRQDPTDDARRRAWLAAQVRPSILDLLGRVSREELLKDLGLNEPKGTSK